MALLNWLRSPKARPTTRQTRTRLGVQQLEAREVPATLMSALGVGNDAGFSSARDVAVDAAGNSYLAGSFSGTIDFDLSAAHPDGADVLTARGYTDVFVAKYAANDSLVWVRRMGGDETSPLAYMSDSANKLELDAAGNVYVVGQFLGTADFGPFTHTSAGVQADGFVTKLSESGTVLWAKQWGGLLSDAGRGVDIDAAGNVYVLGGRMYQTETSLPTYHAQHGLDILKFSPTGSSVWVKYVGTQRIPSSSDLTADAAGNVFVAGAFQGTVDFDPGTGRKEVKSVTSGPSSSGFVLKLTTAGTFGWVSPFVGKTVDSTAGYSRAQSIALDGGGNVVVGGYYGGTVDFNPGTGTTNLPTVGGAFIAKLNNTGALVWAKALESAATTFVYGLAVDATGSIYAAGSLHGTTDFDPGAGTHTVTTAGDGDAYVLKLDADGNFAWAETFGGTGLDIGWGIAVDGFGTVHLAGSYQGTTDFDPDPLGTYFLTNPGSYHNLFLVKLSQN